jgi:hypothetical protein
VLAIVNEALGGEDGLTSLYEAAASAAVVELEKARAASGVRLAKQIVADLDRAEFYNRTAEYLAIVSAALPNASRAYIMETNCLNTTLHILDLLASNLGVPGSGTTSSCDRPKMLEAIKDVSKRLPPDISGKVRRLVNTSTSKNAESITSYLEAYDECAESLDLPPHRPLDKKRERALSAAISAEYSAIISHESDALLSMPAMEALRITVLLLVVRYCNGNLVALAPVSVLPVCAWIEQTTNLDGLAIALGEFRSAVTRGLHVHSEDTDSAGPPVMKDDKLLQRLANVRQYFTAA